MPVWEYRYFIGIDQDGENKYNSFWVEARTAKEAWRKAIKEKRMLNIHTEIELRGWDRRKLC
ncbi:unnamed protein product [marine sediment metagenome]|uniref:Uncharacterized protein n=1 Tax=marine sediment metagenome TaxID=412755 RepID=X0YNY1_9ZZZZ